MEITRGKIDKAKKTIVYGPEGIGKSTFGSRWPDPVFIDTEESTKEMDVARLPVPTSWQMVLQEVEYVRDNPDVCKTLIIDTADKAQKLAIDEMCQEHQCKSVEDPGYGKGYVYVYEKFGKLLNLLDEVVERGIHVVVIAHAAMRKFEQPDELGSYDRWEMKLVSSKNCNVSAMMREWADMVLFVNYKTHTVTEDKEGKKKKALGTGQRVMYTTHHSCWDAKNRYELPDEMPFDFSGIAHIFAKNEQKTAKNDKKQQKTDTNQKMTPPPDEEVSPKNKEKASEKAAKPEPVPSAGGGKELDVRIPKALRDLMAAKNVAEWQVQHVVAHRGYFPEDVPIWNYPQDFIDGCLVAAWDQVYGMIYEMTQKPDPDNPFEDEELEIPFTPEEKGA